MKITEKLEKHIPIILSKPKFDEMYEDRNSAVLWALKNHDGEVGWREHTFGDFVVVWAETDEGEVSWHVPRELVKDCAWLEEKPKDYDYYSTEEKIQRVKNLVKEAVRLEPVEDEESEDDNE